MSSARKRSAVAKANARADHEQQKAMLEAHWCNVFKGYAEAAAAKLSQERRDWLVIVAQTLEKLLLIHGTHMSEEVRDAVVSAFDEIKQGTAVVRLNVTPKETNHE